MTIRKSRRDMIGDRTGATALEFALVAPVIVLAGLAAPVMGMAFWKWSTFESVAAETARCVAIESTACSGSQGGADFAIALLAKRGGFPLKRENINIETIDREGVSFAQARLSFQIVVGGSTFQLMASSKFPKP